MNKLRKQIFLQVTNTTLTHDYTLLTVLKSHLLTVLYIPPPFINKALLWFIRIMAQIWNLPPPHLTHNLPFFNYIPRKLKLVKFFFSEFAVVATPRMTRCFKVTNYTNLTLQYFWKNQFNIQHCIILIDKAWNEVSNHPLKSSWKKLLPRCE